MPKRLQPVVAFFLLSLFMHLVWENVQMVFFEVGNATLWQIFKMCLFATVTGDTLFMVALYLTLTVVHQDIWWSAKRSAYNHPATWVLPIVVGTLLAVNFELWAVYAVQRWRYQSMPLIPFINVGITPVLQMIVVPTVTIAICRWLTWRASI
jgi:phosphate starvation-inducible membrane PsiE